MIILIGGEKGGTGKTTFAVNLAAMRIRNRDLIIVDGEKTQINASMWCALRDANEVGPRIPSVQKVGENLRMDILALSKKYEDVLIDTGGQDSLELRNALLVSDIAISPVTPGQFDLWSLSTLDRLLGEIKMVNEKLRFVVFINKASTHPHDKETQGVIEFFKEAAFKHIELAENIVRFRKSFREIAKTGSSIQELGIDKKAETEIQALYNEVFHG